MTATNRSSVRRPSDFYETPEWCVKVIVPHIKKALSEICSGKSVATILDPGAGIGGISLALYEYLGDTLQVSDGHEYVKIPLIIDAIELEPHLYTILNKNIGNVKSIIPSSTNFFNLRGQFDCIIGNPPYSQALEFVQHARKISNSTWFLLRLDFLGSIKRGNWYRNGNMPDVYVLEKRPSFTGDGNTDSNNYCWMNWHDKQKEGKIRILEC